MVLFIHDYELWLLFTFLTLFLCYETWKPSNTSAPISKEKSSDSWQTTSRSSSSSKNFEIISFVNISLFRLLLNTTHFPICCLSCVQHLKRCHRSRWLPRRRRSIVPTSGWNEYYYERTNIFVACRSRRWVLTVKYRTRNIVTPN